MGDKITEFGIKHGCAGMGSTMAALSYKKGKVYGMNLGDSNIYRLSDAGLQKLSKEHVVIRPGHIKGYLSAYLGGNSSTVPNMFKMKARSGDIFLLCTDGVTNVVSDFMIRKVLACGDSAREIAIKLKETLEGCLPTDNSTAIVLTVRK